MKSQFIFACVALLVIASLIIEGDCFLPTNSKTGRKVISRKENILTNTTTTFNSNRFTKKNRLTERTYRICHFRLPKTLTFKKPFLRKWDLFAFLPVNIMLFWFVLTLELSAKLHNTRQWLEDAEKPVGKFTNTFWPWRNSHKVFFMLRRRLSS